MADGYVTRAIKLLGIKITAQQQEFVRLVALGTPHDEAAVLAGYAPHTGWSVMQSPAVRRVLHLAISEVLVTEGAPLAVKTLLEVVKNKEYSPRDRVAAARTILDRAGYTGKSTSADSPADKPLSEMSTDELKALVDKLEGELADRATPVNAPESHGKPAQYLDFLD